MPTVLLWLLFAPPFVALGAESGSGTYDSTEYGSGLDDEASSGAGSGDGHDGSYPAHGSTPRGSTGASDFVFTTAQPRRSVEKVYRTDDDGVSIFRSSTFWFSVSGSVAAVLLAIGAARAIVIYRQGKRRSHRAFTLVT